MWQVSQNIDSASLRQNFKKTAHSAYFLDYKRFGIVDFDKVKDPLLPYWYFKKKKDPVVNLRLKLPAPVGTSDEMVFSPRRTPRRKILRIEILVIFRGRLYSTSSVSYTPVFSTTTFKTWFISHLKSKRCKRTV